MTDTPDDIWITITNMGDGYPPCIAGPWTQAEAEERVGRWTQAARYVRADADVGPNGLPMIVDLTGVRREMTYDDVLWARAMVRRLCG